MTMHDATVQGVIEHALVDFVNTTTDGLYQSATTYDSIEFQRNVGHLEFVKHQLTAEILLFCDVTKGGQLLC